ncbi:ankyrin repeat-containing domain protein, partial [Colletotrichum phormii]
INERDKLNQTPLRWACERGQEDVVEYLIEQDADIDLCDTWGIYPVAIAMEYGHEEIVTSLLARGAECRSLSLNSNTPLHFAASMGSQSIVKHLVNAGCDPLSQNSSGLTPVMEAILGDWPETVALLLAANSEAGQIRDRLGRTCIHFA